MRLPNDLIRNILFWVQQKRWLIIIALLGAVMYQLPYPDGISHAGYRTLILSLIIISLIITEPIPLLAVALLVQYGMILPKLQSGGQLLGGEWVR